LQLPRVRAGGRRCREGARTLARAEDESSKPPVVYNKQFGYSRKDVILICVGILGLGYALYYGLQAFGVEAAMAGSFTQLIIFIGLSVGWVGSYVYRVANKVRLRRRECARWAWRPAAAARSGWPAPLQKMTYVQQLEQYEEAVMKKRLEELTEDELERMMKEGK
jgi:Protein of unknown function (DUF3007)